MKIKMNIKAPLLLTSFALLSGCATMSKDECMHADWYLKGVDDATKGFPLDLVVEHGKACAKVNITPDMKAYREGHAKGERLYCIPSKGYSEGRNGAHYNGICPADLEGGFLKAYRDGQELFSIQNNINNLSNAINNSKNNIDSNYNQISELKRDIVYSPDSKDRREKMERIDRLEDDNRRLSRDIDRDSHELELYKNDYRIVEEKHFRMGYIN